MKYVLLIYQDWTGLPNLSEEQKKVIGAEYAVLNNAPGITPGLPLGLPADATTVRVKDGKTQSTQGPVVDTKGAIGGYYVIEADDLDAAVAVASRVPAARLGGAIEIRPSAAYW